MKILFCIPGFLVGFIFFAVMGCGIFSLIGGFIFALLCLSDYKFYCPKK